jgi:Cof subfamily protein (haloacid dehalogenase superfamily)
MIPLIILDIDGTIIGSKGFVEDCVWRVIEKARGHDVKFAVCTGRPCFGVAQKVAQRLGDANLHIFQNGAQISTPSGASMRVSALKEAVVRQLVDFSREEDLSLELYTPTNLYVERKTQLSEAHAQMIGVNAIVADLLEIVQQEPIIRAQWVVPDSIRDTLLSTPPEGTQFGWATSPAMQDISFISITAQTVSKGSAVKTLIEAMKLDASDVMAIGDSLGDVPMLDAVGIPVVMDNGHALLKERYENVAGHVDSCGVVGVIEAALRDDLS